MNSTSNECPFCGLSSVMFDRVLDMNTCILCGARETTTGWQRPELPSQPEPIYQTDHEGKPM